jgi:hypothetical protein
MYRSHGSNDYLDDHLSRCDQFDIYIYIYDDYFFRVYLDVNLNLDYNVADHLDHVDDHSDADQHLNVYRSAYCVERPDRRAGGIFLSSWATSFCHDHFQV